jgi:hypothetical protein
MRILVTGSRTFDDALTIRQALDAVAFGAIGGRYQRLVVVHGAAPRGADAIADMWVRSWTVDELHVTAERHPALWNEHGKRAGMVRNATMVHSGADLVLAFIRDDSPGATHCAELAGEAGLPLQIFRYGEPGVVSINVPEPDAEAVP